VENKRNINSLWFQKIAIYVVFGLFTAQAQAGLLPVPVINAQPLSTNVLKGDTVTFSISASCSLSLISSVSWYYSNKLVQTTSSVLGLGSTITSSYTVSNASSANVGGYYAEIGNLLGGNVKSDTAQLVVTNPIIPLAGIPGASKMLSGGFMLQFSAPIGSNVVIEATSDMNSWSPICTNVSASGSVTYTDAVAKTVSCRFYRARLK
jgi:hypothetical protein